MSAVFLKLLNMSIAAGWLVVAVIVLRLCLKKAPKAIHCALWALVAIRLICPFSLESSFSLIPEAVANGSVVSEWTEDYIDDIDIHHPSSVYYDAAIGAGREPISDGEGGYYVVTKHDQLGEPATIENTVVPVLSWIWIAGVAALLLYAAISFLRIRARVKVSLNWKDNIWCSEQVDSPFILGVIRPKIYLPFGMDEAQMSYVVAHEQAHLNRRDYWWKPLGFILLAIYWFNPLMWVAYILLCRDIELACDEKVIRDMGAQDKKAYSEALLACSVPRRMIAACPLAFGEVGVKKRIASVLHYKQPAFWILIVALIASVAVAVCFLTNPAAEREFPINGKNVSDLDTVQVVEKIAKAEKLEDASQLCVNADNFDLMFTSDFDWANDGAIRFFYGKNQKIYSAQLRMFHDDNKYFITDSSEWIEEEKIFLLSHYLDALKYMPQEEIRQLSPDADGYSVYMRHEGAPSDYERVLKYSQNGIEEGDGWYIHFEVQPLHKVEGGGYNGRVDEVIHIFYGQYSASSKPEDALAQLGGNENLSLDDVVTLSQKGYDLTWSDFNQYRYIETGSGLYIRVYKINEMFELWIGGSWPDSDPMYIYLSLADDLDTRIDIRDGGVEEFITRDHSETLLNSAIYDAILNHNLSEKTVGLNNCANFVMLDKEEISGTPVVGSTDHVGMVTVYGLALYQGYDLVNDELREEAGSHIPVAITFDVLNGKYSLKEYWTPRDGTYYAPDVRDKFPDKIEEEAMNTQKYIAAQKQECYVQAMRNNGVEVSDPDQQILSIEEQSAAVNAIFTNLKTGWWNGNPLKNCAYESAAFECLHREVNENIATLYGYGGYFRWDRSKSCTEQWYAPTVVTLDIDTQEILDLWWPGDGAAYESSILNKFPESIASTVAEPDSVKSAAVRTRLMEASKESMVSVNQTSEAGQTRRFGVQDLRVEITNVLSTHKTFMLAEGIEPHEYVVVSCTPESKITILNAGMSDPAYAEDGKAHEQWGFYYEYPESATSSSLAITDNLSPVSVDKTLKGVFSLESSLYVIQLNLVD